MIELKERRRDTVVISNSTLRRLVLAGNLMQGQVGIEPTSPDKMQEALDTIMAWERALSQLRGEVAK